VTNLLNGPLVALIKTIGVLGAILVLLYSCSSLRTETYLSEGTSPRGFDEYCTEWTLEFFGGERQVRRNCHAVDPDLMPAQRDSDSGTGSLAALDQERTDYDYTGWDMLYSESAQSGQTP
jgi:hypothetical protein